MKQKQDFGDRSSELQSLFAPEVFGNVTRQVVWWEVTTATTGTLGKVQSHSPNDFDWCSSLEKWEIVALTQVAHKSC